jgi:Glycosyl hydrolase 2 galactose-binding domain-like/Exo-beta-D-glucosaminidase Ig-fold domain/NedA-like, galactose-binding domain/Glycosyl hydrolases family 2
MNAKRLVLLALLLGASPPLEAQIYTRGVGIYPGDPRQDFAPVLEPGPDTYRNLALHRPAYHSSSYDYDLTAQLVTDGIVDTTLPRWVATATSDKGPLAKSDREHLLDHNPVTTVDLTGPEGWVQVELGGGETPLEVDRLEVDARPQLGLEAAAGWRCVVLGSDDGELWTELGRAGSEESAYGKLHVSVELLAPSRLRLYRVELEGSGVEGWRVGEIAFFDRNERVPVGGPYDFTSAWKSAGTGEEWVSVDLGRTSTFDRVVLRWIRRAAAGDVQVSDDATHWRPVRALPADGGSVDDLALAPAARGRYVRALLTRPSSAGGYVLSEIEVYGRGGLVPRPRAQPAVQAGGRLDLAGGRWRVQRASIVSAEPEAISKAGFADGDWLPATVPGTVLASYLNAGAVPDPDYGANQLMISDSFFCADFWYRDEFALPSLAPGRHLWLDFDGVNWKATVYLNGVRLGDVAGGFERGRFDVTSLVQQGAPNALAVLVRGNATPGSVKEKTLERPDWNGGALGADNPTYHASVGWDWIPTIRGRDSGLWGTVFLTSTGPVTLVAPFVSTTLPLPDTTTADVRVEVTLHNLNAGPVSGTLRGRFGSLAFARPVTVPAASAVRVVLDPGTNPALHIDHPRLWWPAGYGEAALYHVALSFAPDDGPVSDATSFETGVREFTYTEEGGALRLYVNGRRFIARGGNWGFPESMLRYRAREYDVALRYHQDMNFTMIRNWVGQTADDAFFEACDRHGIVVWQDFWLANPADGPDPEDDPLFLRNAADFIERIRNHPSIGLYCGRNEGNPPTALDDGLRGLVATLHPGLRYISNSAFGEVSGGGPYRAMPRRFYFAQRATPKLHSELGMPNVPTFESLKQMMPAEDLWPQDDVWGLHDFCLNGAQGGSAFREIVDKGYGGATSAEEWVRLAQLVDYDGYRAMFEAQGKNRMGVLLWMSHPAWPSFVWQTYDYYFEPTAAYFGAKKACEPLHVQWNPLTDGVEVVNYSAGNATGLEVRAEIRSLDGSLQWEKTATLDSAEDSVATPLVLEYPSGLSAVHFIRLSLTRDGKAVSRNLYWRGVEEGHYTALRDLPEVALRVTTRAERAGERWQLTTELEDTSDRPAVMVRIRAVRERSGDRILPALYSDNYITLMPGERRTISTDLADADTRGERPRVVVEGLNVGEVRED